MSNLLKSSDLSTEKIKDKLKGSIGRNILFYERIGSTNTIAYAIAEETDEGTVVIANSQEKGKGRLGRVWISPPDKNIYMSIIIKPNLISEDVTLITLMAAVACTRALKRLTDLDIRIKWPNDLILNDRKFGGILTELKIHKKRVIFAVIGIGLNINVDINVFPQEIRDISTSILNETGKLYSRSEIIAEILDEIDYWYKVLKEDNRLKILSEWERLSCTLGREIKVIINRNTYFGLAESIDNQGMLMLRLSSGELMRISSGDVKVL